MRAEVMTLGTPNRGSGNFWPVRRNMCLRRGREAAARAGRCGARPSCWRCGTRGYVSCWCGEVWRSWRPTIWRFCGRELADVAEYRAGERQFRFCNGSVLQFGYCGCDRDLDRYQGAEYDVIFLDEATQLKEQWMRQIAACVRGVNDFPKRIYYTCNPGGPGHGYIKRLFIDRRFEDGEQPEDYALFRHGSRTTRRCWRGSRTISRRWRPCPTN